MATRHDQSLSGDSSQRVNSDFTSRQSAANSKLRHAVAACDFRP